MSILIEKDNCVLISHEKYLNQLYSNINGSSLEAKSDLFAINKPFKLLNQSKKRTHDSSLDLHLQKEIQFVQSKYIECKDLIVATFNKKTNKDETNQNAIETASDLLESSFENETKSFNGANTTESCMLQTLNEQDFLFPPRCTFLCKDLTKPNELEIISDKFDVILMDPPWWNKAVRRKNWKAQGAQGYSMMYNEDIEKLPIDKWLAPNGVVFIWCTNAPSHQCAINEFLTAWGLTHCGTWYWLKVTQSGEPIMPFSHFPKKQPFEQIVIGAKVPNAELWSAHANKVIVSVPSALHSHKPPLCEIIDNIFKSKRCMELFARNLLPGWTSVGMEVIKLQNTRFYTKCCAKQLVSQHI